MIRANTTEYARLFAKALTTEQIAGLLNALLGMEAESKYTDRECEIGQRLFDALCQRCPEAVEQAQQG